MAALRSLVMLTAGAVMGAAAVIAYRLSEETGKPLQETIADVPAEIGRLCEDLKAKTLDEIDRARVAWEDRQQESAEHLTERGAVEK